MSRAYIKCRCGATGYGSAVDCGFGTTEIIEMPEEWENDGHKCNHSEKFVIEVEILAGSEEDQEYEMGGY